MVFPSRRGSHDLEELADAPTAARSVGKLARDPHAKSLKVWHQLLLTGLLYEAAAVPFVITFDRRVSLWQDPLVLVFYTWEALFLCDFYVKLTTGFYRKGIVVYDIRQVRRRYLTSMEFIVDVLAIFPYAVIPATLPVSAMVLEVPKVLRAYRVPRYLSNVDDIYVRHFELLKLSKLLVGVVLLSHYIACIRFSFGYDTHHNNHWLPAEHAHEPTIRTQYLQSMFWAFGLLTGLFEGELPHTSEEFVFTIAVAVCGFSVFTYLCATFFFLSKCEATNSEVSDARIAQLKHILTFHNVPDHVRNPIVEYLRNYYAGNDTSDREVMKLLCPSIAKEVQVELLKDIVAKIPVFSGCNPELIELLTSLLERIYLPSQCTLFHVGEFGDAMYIIQAGVLDVIGRSGKLRELRKNDIVGELSLFSNLPRSATVVTSTYCVLYKLSRFHTEIVMESYPKAASRMKSLVSLIMKKTQNLPRGKPNPDSSGLVGDRRKSGGNREPQTTNQSGRLSGANPPNTILVESQRRLPSSSILRLIPRLRHRVIDSASTANNEIIDSFAEPHRTKEVAGWWAYFLLEECLDCAGPYRVAWIAILQLVLMYNWCLIPLQLAFPAFNDMGWFIYVMNGVADAILWADLYVNFNLAFMQASEKIRDTTKSALRYMRGPFMLDLVCTFPYEAFVHPSQHCVSRIPRLLRFWRASGHFREVDAMHPLHSKQRLLLFAILLFLLIHIETCLYFSVTYFEGFSSDAEAWLPHQDIELHRVNDTHFVGYGNVSYTTGDPDLAHIATMQYMRSFYFATHKLTGLGKGVEPESDLQYIVGLIFMLSGFFITAIVVDHVQKRFTASTHEEKEFFAVRARIQTFLRRQDAPIAIYQRVNAFLEFWWASHRGALLDELLCDLPTTFKKDVLRSIYTPALQSVALLSGVRPVLDELEDVFIANAGLMLYGQGEFIYREGDSMHGLYILLQGTASFVKASRQSTIFHGSFFGTRILQAGMERSGYTESAVAENGCVVLFLSRTTIQQIHTNFPAFGQQVLLLEKRQSQLVRTEVDSKILEDIESTRSSRWTRWVRQNVIDPDSRYVVAWETWLSIAMTIQWAHVVVNICFGTKQYVLSDSVTVGLELSFLLDIYIRSCLGYREFGNKVMDLKLIRRRYFRSWYFVVDVVALLPVFMVNWIPGFRRSELLNVNKMLRLMKVPNQFRALEQRYIKFATELRLMKLVYYTFASTHILGCIYFDFSSNASGIGDGVSFAENAWALPKSLEYEDTVHQYFAANFWAFAVMSASYTGELPESTLQCLHSIVTQITGFFLFAYVIGNFTDVIELANAEDREFNSRFGSIRRLLVHFTLPAVLESKVKMLLFFKRFHSITQEEVLEHYLPPPILTDIRLVNLQPMIDKVPFLKNMDISITRMLVSQFRQRLMLKDEYVYKYGDEGTDMYFVFTGILSMFAPLRKASSGGLQTTGRSSSDTGLRVPLQKVSDVLSGDFFGENALFVDAPRSSFVRTKTSCILYSLSRQSLNLVFELYPNWMNRVLQTVKIQQKMQKQQTTADDSQVRRSFIGPPLLQVGGPSNLLTGLHIQNALSSRTTWSLLKSWFADLSRVYEAQSRPHVAWLRIVTAATFYVAFMMPSCIAFQACGAWSGLSLASNLVEVCCFVVFVLDIWINLHLKETELTTELYEVKIRDVYRRERLVVDLIAALPVEYVLSSVPPPASVAWLGVNRCVKVLNVVHYMNEIHHQSVSFEWAYFQTITLLYVVLIYWGACIYLVFADHEGYSTEWNSWFPSTELELHENMPQSHLNLRLLRGLFFSVTAFIKKGRTFLPEGQGYIFAIVVCFIGLMVMAFMIGEVASLYISSIENEVSYRKTHIAVEHTVARWKVSRALNGRVQKFLADLWSSHRGIVYQDVFGALPSQIREEMMLHIVDLPLQALVFKVFRPLLQGGGPSLDRITHAVAGNLRFDCYPSGERVVVEGRMPEGIFFVVAGKLMVTSKELGDDSPITHYTKGDFFGERGVLTHFMCASSVQTLVPSELVALAAGTLQSILRGDEFFAKVLSVAQSVVDQFGSTLNDTSVFPVPPQIWEERLRSLLEQQRLQWSPLSSALSKTEAHWRVVVRNVLDKNDAPLSCLQVFRPFLEMVGPPAELFERSAVRRASRSHGNTRNLQRNQFRSFVDHLGAVAISTASRVAPILSSMSRRGSIEASAASRRSRNSISAQGSV